MPGTSSASGSRGRARRAGAGIAALPLALCLSLSDVARAEPPRGEVNLGFSGNTDQGYGFVTFQPALLRSEDASMVLRATVSQLYYTFYTEPFPPEEILNEVGSPGVSVGPGFVYTPGDFSLGVGVGLGMRRSTLRTEGVRDSNLELDASLTGDVQWRPQQKAAIYGLFSFTAANPYLWARVGATASVIPFLRPNAPVAIWLGGEVTSNGNFESRLLEIGPVLEVPVRDIHTVFSLRGGVALEEDNEGNLVQAPTVGLGVYWWY